MTVSSENYDLMNSSVSGIGEKRQRTEGRIPDQAVLDKVVDVKNKDP